MAIAPQTMVDNITAAINALVGDGTNKPVQEYRIGDTSYKYIDLPALREQLEYFKNVLREESRPSAGRRSVVSFGRP